MTMDFAITCSLVRPGRPRYPVFVHRAASLLHASFRPHLAVTPLRFANPSPPSGWVKDLHLQAVDHARHTIGIGGSLTTPPLPHHRTYGSVSGGSLDYAADRATTEAKPRDRKNAVGMAMVSAGLFASRQGPCGLPAVCAARSRPTPQRRSSVNRVGPRFHCFQAMARNRRLSHSSSLRNIDGVWQKPK